MQSRQFSTSTMHLAQELLTNVQCSGGSRSFAKELRLLTMMSTVAGYQKLTQPIQRIIKADPLTTTQKVAKEHSMVIQHLRQTGKVKKLGASWANHKSKKSSFWSVIFSYSMPQWTTSRSDYDMQWKVYSIQPVTTSSVAGLRRSSKALPKAKLWEVWQKVLTKKVMITVWWSDPL